MTYVAWFPVRCCCTPLKIFGFMRLPISAIDLPRYSLYDRNGEVRHIRFKEFSPNRTTITQEFREHATPETLRWLADRVECERAIYSDDQPIEYWRGFEEFVEVRS